MDENDLLSENNNIPLGHNRSNRKVYFKDQNQLQS